MKRVNDPENNEDILAMQELQDILKNSSEDIVDEDVAQLITISEIKEDFRSLLKKQKTKEAFETGELGKTASFKRA